MVKDARNCLGGYGEFSHSVREDVNGLIEPKAIGNCMYFQHAGLHKSAEEKISQLHWGRVNDQLCMTPCIHVVKQEQVAFEKNIMSLSPIARKE